MLEIVGQFRLQYNDQAQGMLGNLVATPSLLSSDCVLMEGQKDSVHQGPRTVRYG